MAGATVPTPTGWSVAQSGNVFTFSRSADLAAGTSDTLNVTFTTNITTGKGFTLSAAAAASNAPQTNTTATVQPTPAKLAISGTGSWAAKGSSTLNSSFTIQDTGGAGADTVTVTYQFPNGNGDHWAPTVTAPAGWSVTGSGSATIVFTRLTQLAGGASETVQLVFTATQPSNFGKAVAIQVTATATGVASANTTISVAKSQ
jgi:hypothetical protein